MIEEMKERLLEHKTVAAVLGTVLVMLVAFFAWSSMTRPKTQLQSDLPALSSSIQASSSFEPEKTKTMTSHFQDDSGKIFIDIKGAVKNEGVYELSSGSRVTDLVKKAGGFTDDADQKSVNLAEKLADEAVVYVARIGEGVTPATTPSQAKNGTQEGASSDKINLNTATLEQLQTISGIGAKRAQDIIDYREANGGFSSVDDLKNVSGIGEKTLEKLKAEVTVD
ncbi:helix-hairpin-helix domain-containing protein [Streptococcus equinus]|uniref:helix-hairpin-helix domain-containing protein n=1 Tax=Streptococcus equinus TaxID=1335 RepID=UPI00215AAA49|nr:helix-hairpin-helix domain-containing protein [Streptococcus equinus]UVF03279.1 helix-hairpin-helix domain-containing protein [Streptococcus equinus]